MTTVTVVDPVPPTKPGVVVVTVDLQTGDGLPGRLGLRTRALRERSQTGAVEPNGVDAALIRLARWLARNGEFLAVRRPRRVRRGLELKPVWPRLTLLGQGTEDGELGGDLRTVCHPVRVSVGQPHHADVAAVLVGEREPIR